MKRCLMTVCCVALVVSAVLAQQKKTLSHRPKPTDEGPSLEVTMKFIQDKLNDVGGVSFLTFATQTTDNSTFSHRWTVELSNVVANPADCSIRYHGKMTLDGGPGNIAADVTMSLAGYKNVQLEPSEQYVNKEMLCSDS
jgi:hypothetical protein